MKVSFKRDDGKVELKKLGYGNCCALDGHCGVFMYLKTSQRLVNIHKTDEGYKATKGNNHKLLDLASGDIICVAVGTRVTPLDAEVVVHG